jgi:hypothetical protein
MCAAPSPSPLVESTAVFEGSLRFREDVMHSWLQALSSQSRFAPFLQEDTEEGALLISTLEEVYTKRTVPVSGVHSCQPVSAHPGRLLSMILALLVVLLLQYMASLLSDVSTHTFEPDAPETFFTPYTAVITIQSAKVGLQRESSRVREFER